MSLPICYTQRAMESLRDFKGPTQHPHFVKDVGRFIVSQIGCALAAVASMIESAVYLPLACISLLFAPCNARPLKFLGSLWKSSAYTAFWAITEFLSFSLNNRYSTPERLFRVAVFQRGVQDAGCLEDVLITDVYCAGALDPVKIRQHKDALTALGAHFNTWKTDDGQADISVMDLNAQTFANKIHQARGKWERRQIRNKTCFVIEPPPQGQRSADWSKLELAMNHFHWKREGDLYITCEHADLIPQHQEGLKLFVNVNNPGVTSLMLTRKMGYYLGMKQNICFYDQRGQGESTGIASEAGYQNDLMCVLGKLREQVNWADVWVNGTCGSCPTAGYALKQFHAQGLNVILESGFGDLRRDFVEPQNLLAEGIALRAWRGLSATDFRHKNQETGFSLEGHWKDLDQGAGQAIVVTVTNDDVLKPEVGRANFALAQKVSNQATHVQFRAAARPERNKHSASYTEDPTATRQAITAIFA